MLIIFVKMCVVSFALIYLEGVVVRSYHDYDRKRNRIREEMTFALKTGIRYDSCETQFAMPYIL